MKIKRLILSFVFLFVFLFGLAACQSACETHDYTAWQVITAPTETTTGQATRYCLKCKEVEKLDLPKLSETDYILTGVEGKSCSEQESLKYTLKSNNEIVILASGHHGDIYCEKCGQSLVPQTFWTNMTTASNYTSFTLKLDSFNLESQGITIKNAEAELSLGETFEDTKVFGRVTIVQNATAQSSNYCFEYENNTLYTSVESGGTTLYGQKDVTSIVGYVKSILTKIEDYFKNSEKTEVSGEQVLEFIKKLCKTGTADGKYKLMLDANKVRAINNNLKDKSIKDLTGLKLDDYKLFVTTLIDNYSITGLVNMIEYFMSDLFVKVENVLNTVLNMVPNTVLASLFKDPATTQYTPVTLLTKVFGLLGVANEKMAQATTIKEVICALDSSVDQEDNKVLASADLVRLFKITPKEGESNSDALFRAVTEIFDKTIYSLIAGVLGMDESVLYALVDQVLNETLNNTFVPEIYINTNGVIDSGKLIYTSGNAKTTVTLKLNDHITPVVARQAQ